MTQATQLQCFELGVRARDSVLKKTIWQMIKENRLTTDKAAEFINDLKINKDETIKGSHATK